MQKSILGHRLDGRYHIVRKLASGGFGQTYIAEDSRRPGNPCCVVKLLKPASNDPEFLKNARRLFNTEAEALEVLGNHSQIPRLLAYFEELGDFYLVQEYVDGTLLTEELLIGQRWTADKTVKLVEEILTVLRFIHSHNVIHRDIKPDNIIRRRHDNTLVLVDFGTVKQVRTQVAVAGLATATISVGTPGYMPTEQSHGKPRPNSDIYALGIIAIQAITGLHPTQIQEDPESGELIWEPWAACDQGLAQIVSKMVRYHFRDRYRSASEALHALSRYSANDNFNREPATWVRTDKRDKRHVRPAPQSTVIVQRPADKPSQKNVLQKNVMFQHQSGHKSVNQDSPDKLPSNQLGAVETEVYTNEIDNKAAETMVADRRNIAALETVCQLDPTKKTAASASKTSDLTLEVERAKTDISIPVHAGLASELETSSDIADRVPLPTHQISNSSCSAIADSPVVENISRIDLLDNPANDRMEQKSTANFISPLETIALFLQAAWLHLINSHVFSGRWQKLGIAGCLTFGVAVGGNHAVKERSVWLQANQKVAQIKAFQTEQSYENCIASAQAVPQRYRQLYETTQNLMGFCLLEQAKVLSKENRLKDAINTAADISPGMTSYSEAQRQIQSWAESIVDIATDGYKQGKFELAKGIIQAVPKNASVYAAAQEALQNWESEWENNTSYLSVAEVSLEEKKWQAAIDETKKVTLLGHSPAENSPYWKSALEPIITKAEQEISAAQQAEQQRLAALAAAAKARQPAPSTSYSDTADSYAAPVYSEPVYTAPAPSYAEPSYSAPPARAYSAPPAPSGGWTSEQR